MNDNSQANINNIDKNESGLKSGFRRKSFKKKSNFKVSNIKDLKDGEFKKKEFEKEESEEVINNFIFPEEFSFQNFNVDKRILYSIFKAGFMQPTEIQKQTLSWQEDGDLIAQSNTGSGKTLAFTIPVLNDILQKRRNKVLILAPTREIAFQIHELMVKVVKWAWKMNSIVLVGGVPIQRQIERLKNNISILIGTPGRIIDLLDRKKLDLSEVDFVVLDEFDRMLDMGFRDEVRTIMKECNKNKKAFMFSATLNDKVKQDSLEYLKNPKVIVVKNQEDTSINPNIKQFFEHYEGYEEKKKKLSDILKNYHGKSVLIFTNTKSEAEKIVEDLGSEDIASEFIHGDLQQKKRQAIMKNFGDKFRILVATDLVARGINISSLELVINYDIPKNIEDYTHRIGRTARGENKEGHSISLFHNRDAFFLNDLMKILKIKIENEKVLEVIQNRSSRSGSRSGGGRRGGFSSSRSFGGRSFGGDRGSFRERGGSGYQSGDRSFSSGRSSFGGGFGRSSSGSSSFGSRERGASNGFNDRPFGGFDRDSSRSKDFSNGGDRRNSKFGNKNFSGKGSSFGKSKFSGKKGKFF